jgi:hypothetical protein
MSTKIQGKYSGQGQRLVFFDSANSNETVLPVADVVFYDDFIGQAYDSTHNWTAKDTGAATEALVANAANGVFALTLTNANEKQEAGIYANDVRHWTLNQGVVFEARIKAAVLPTGQAELYFGLAGNYVEGPISEADAGPAEHIFFCLDGSGAVLLFTDDGTTDTDATATGVTLLNTDWAVCKIDCADPTDVKFYINGSRVGSATTHSVNATPTLQLQPFIIAHKETGTGVGTLYVDYVRIYQNRA